MPESSGGRSFLLVMLVAIAGWVTAAEAQPGRPADIDRYVVTSLANWQVAGLAIAIVHDDSVVFARGYGVREVGKPDRVSPETVFSIGSMTKFFTAVAAGMMVDAGKVAWDEPLGHYLPGFAVGDPYVTQHLSLRDALSHRTGLDWRLDFLWFGTALTREQVLARLRSFVPEPGFRTGYGYSNVMFSAAGEAVAHAAGVRWEDLIRSRIFVPLGMRSSYPSFADLPARGNLAMPHLNLDGAPRPIEPVPIANVPAAGAINSNVLDLAQWLRFVLADGRHDGKQLIASKTLHEILAPQVVVGSPDSLLRPFATVMLYGLGAEILDYKGHRLIKHGGRVDGMLSEFAMVPDRKLGVVVLTNTSGAAGLPPELPEALVYRVVDAYLGGARPDWSAGFLAERRAVLARRAAARRAPTGFAPTEPPLPLTEYAGRYLGPIGPVPVSPADHDELERTGPFATVTVEGDGLQLRFGPIAGRLEHLEGNSFRVYWDVVGYLGVRFVPDRGGALTRLEIGLVGDFERSR